MYNGNDEESGRAGEERMTDEIIVIRKNDRSSVMTVIEGVGGEIIENK